MPNEPERSLSAAEVQGMARELGRLVKASSDSVPPPLTSLEGRYEILQLIERGGMGAVYKARRRSDDQLVAIKTLPEELIKDEHFRDRFTRESATLSKLSHPHIVSVIEWIDDDITNCLVMEYIEGQSLRALIDHEVPPAARAIEIVREIGEALRYAHEAGVVHRDVKPNNVLLDHDEKVKVVDFGLAKIVGDATASYSLTATGSTLGTPIYVAPELCEGSANVDQRADVYSLGVLFYELLTGKLPLGNFRPPSKEKNGVPPSLDRLILKALNNHPGGRWPSIEAMLNELHRVANRSFIRRMARPAVILACGCLTVMAALALYQKLSGTSAPTPAPDRAASIAEARADLPYVNTLGMRFVPVGGNEVWFSIWETRVADFQAFVNATEHDARPGYYSYDDKGEKSAQGDDWSSPGFSQTEQHPVVGINWHDAIAFCGWLTEYERTLGKLSDPYHYRLPSNEEWSKAADLNGAGYPWGEDSHPPGIVGNLAGTEFIQFLPKMIHLPDYDDGSPTTSPVGHFPSNRFGIHDLVGNVWEWTESKVDANDHTSFRGASWTNGKLDFYSRGLNHRWSSHLRVNDIGFRVVLAAAASENAEP